VVLLRPICAQPYIAPQKTHRESCREAASTLCANGMPFRWPRPTPVGVSYLLPELPADGFSACRKPLAHRKLSQLS